MKIFIKYSLSLCVYTGSIGIAASLLGTHHKLFFVGGAGT